MENLNAEVALLDMWYGTRAAWRERNIPLEMDVSLANPAYVEHCARDPESAIDDLGPDPLGDWHGRNQ